MRPVRHVLMPGALLAVGVWLLAGCIFIPTFNKVDKGDRNYSKKVGDAGSRKPLRVGRATRDQVMRLLGPPELVSPDGRRAAYEWHVTNGIWIFPLCFRAVVQRGERTLFLDFDESGVLRGFHISKIDGNFVWGEPYGLDDHEPEGMIPWGLNRWPDEPERTVTSQPSTR